LIAWYSPRPAAEKYQFILGLAAGGLGEAGLPSWVEMHVQYSV
jgi:hypothetical protein